MSDGSRARNDSRLHSVLTVARSDLRRLGRDRVALFFVCVLPFILIVAIGSFVPKADVNLVVGVVRLDDSPQARDLVAAIDRAKGVEVVAATDRRDAERDARIGRLNAVIVVPAGYGAAVARGNATVDVAVDPTSASASLVRSTMAKVIGARSTRLTVLSVLEAKGVADAAPIAEQAAAGLQPSKVVVRTLGTTGLTTTSYAFVAAGEMLLFMFVNSLAAGSAFIEMRRLGVLGRVLAGPVDGGDVLTGIGLARFGVATALAAVIIVLARVAYGIDWGSVAVVASVVVLFALVCAGASTLIGALFDEPDAATSVGIPVGLGMAALGGCMFPLFLAPPAMQVAAKVLTPHAWAISALVDSSYSGAGVAELWPNLVVLAAWAIVLTVLGRSLARRKIRNG